MPFCGFKKKMIHGIAIFAEGLFEATLERAKEEGKSIEEAFEYEVREISMFLEALENKHQELKKNNSQEVTMQKAVEWIDNNDKK